MTSAEVHTVGQVPDGPRAADPAGESAGHPHQPAERTGPGGAVRVPGSVERRLTTHDSGGPRAWLATAGLVVVAGVLRLIGLGHPRGMIFDEIYYAREGKAMLSHGVEWKDNAAEYVVHPPLGKWLIALGELIYGDNAMGWRIASVVAGTLSVLVVALVARRLFGSTVLALTAGLLMTLDGMQFVLSRVALLDVFLMLFVLAAFGCLVADRDQRRRRALAELRAGVDPAAGRLRLGVPWWRVAGAVMIGCGCAVKWSGLWYLILFAALIVAWEVALRRAIGARHPWRAGLLTGAGWAVAFTGIAVVLYVSSWTGWLLTDDGFDRHWLQARGRHEAPYWGALYNLWQYHREAFGFHTSLTSKHPYQSWPWQWLLLGRPVLMYSDFKTTACGAPSCGSEVLLLGTPILWWSFLPALVALAWFAISRRDWRAWTIWLGAAAGILPWFYYELDHRTMFTFYALPAEPFLVLAVAYVLGAMIGPARAPGTPLSDRRLFGTTAAAVYVTLVALTFAYFYPVYTGGILTYQHWYARMWLGSRWI
jgi:dolichyl-phosphate-mannose-protein mannosyltransferase